MSGAEAVAILGIISSVISIIDGTKQVYDAASNPNGLPEAFREVAARLPMVRGILASAQQRIGEVDADEDSYEAAKNIVRNCQSKAQNLEEIFKKVIPADDASRSERYFVAVKSLGKGNRVETLMKGMLEDLQLLAINHGMVTKTDMREKELAKSVKEVAGPKDEAQACLQALFQALKTDPRDDRSELIQRKETRVEHTCTWITSNQLYQSWLHSCSQLLWLSGGPGKGKTMMSIFLAEHLEQFTEHSPGAVSLEFFCDNKNNERNTAESIIQALIFQLLHKKEELMKHILPTFAIQRASLFSGSSFESLWRIFVDMTCDPVLRTIYCVLDGLDECEEASAEVLLRHLKALFSDTNETRSSRLNVIAVSRDRPEIIPELLSDFPRIQLDLDADTEVAQDVTRFIDTKLDYIFSLKKYPEPTRVMVKNIFRERAQGTFLWIGIAAKMLEGYSAIEFEKALKRLPPGLNDLYARILLGIRVEHRQVAARILRWVVMAVRPLTLAELGAIIEPTIEPPTGFTREDVIKKQVSYCGYFITIESCEVNLIHQSAKDYLLRSDHDSNPGLRDFRMEKKAGHHEIARKCLQYLEDNLPTSKDIDLDTSLSEAFPLLSYATRYWHVHARSLSRSDDIFDLSRPFYRKKSRVRELWLKDCREHIYPMRASTDPSKLLHIASNFDILPLVEKLLTQRGLMKVVKRSHLINQRDSEGKTALYWAAVQRNLAMVRLLLNRGADVNAKHQFDQTALQAAACFGREGVVQLLFEMGADVNAKDKTGMTALHFAAWFGHEGVVQLLLEMGADVNAKSKPGTTALHMAARYGSEGVVPLLLEMGADVNAKKYNGATALHMAAKYGRYGSEGVIRLLIKRGADVNAKDKNGKTALHKAAQYGYEGVIQLLREREADINAKDKDGMTALVSG